MGKKTRATHKGDTNVLEEVALRKSNPKTNIKEIQVHDRSNCEGTKFTFEDSNVDGEGHDGTTNMCTKMLEVPIANIEFASLPREVIEKYTFTYVKHCTPLPTMCNSTASTKSHKWGKRSMQYTS